MVHVFQSFDSWSNDSTLYSYNALRVRTENRTFELAAVADALVVAVPEILYHLAGPLVTGVQPVH